MLSTATVLAYDKESCFDYQDTLGSRDRSFLSLKTIKCRIPLHLAAAIRDGSPHATHVAVFCDRFLEIPLNASPRSSSLSAIGLGGTGCGLIMTIFYDDIL